MNKNKQKRITNNKQLLKYKSQVYSENNQQVKQFGANSYFQWMRVDAFHYYILRFAFFK